MSHVISFVQNHYSLKNALKKDRYEKEMTLPDVTVMKKPCNSNHHINFMAATCSS